MKVLFVGDGRHEIGPSVFAPQPRPAIGVMATLCRKISPVISTESVALSWVELSRFDPQKRKGWEHKLIAAKELAARKYGCLGTIAVVDQDRDSSRIEDLRAGQARIQNDASEHAVAVGMAIESIEAWTLGDPQAVASVLNVAVAEIVKHYSEARVESYFEQSGKIEHQPKQILERVTSVGHRRPDDEFRAEVAQKTDLTTLERNCPKGFAPFAADVRKNFPTI